MLNINMSLCQYTIIMYIIIYILLLFIILYITYHVIFMDNYYNTDMLFLVKYINA